MALKDYNTFNEHARGDYFVGREDALTYFRNRLNGLRNGTPNHALVAGPNGTGKSSFLRRISEIARAEGFATAFVDFQSESGDTVVPILHEVVRGVQSALGGNTLTTDWDLGVGAKLFEAPKSNSPGTQSIVRDLGELKDRMRDRVPGVLICIDEGRRITSNALSMLKLVLADPDVDRFLVFFSMYSPSSHNAVAAARQELREKAHSAAGDHGADAFLKGGIALGPFETEEEAAKCIRVRLVDNVVTFEDEVTRLIARIEDRHPRRTIDLAHEVYEATAQRNDTTATFEHLILGFESMHPREKDESLIAYEQLQPDARKAVCALLQLRRPSTADDVATALYPSAEGDLRERLVTSIRNDLDLACDARVLSQAEGIYKPRDPARAFAFELAAHG